MKRITGTGPYVFLQGPKSPKVKKKLLVGTETSVEGVAAFAVLFPKVRIDGWGAVGKGDDSGARV